MKPIGRPVGPGPVHRFIDTWLRAQASSPRYLPRVELVRAVTQQMVAGVAGFGWLRDAGDMDRAVRALAVECSDFGMPVASGPNGYTSADPADPRPWMTADLQDLKRIRALRRRMRRRRWAREAEARRRAGERAVTPGALFDLATVTLAPRRAVYA